jgi:Xaa-Pro aminopeptidase
MTTPLSTPPDGLIRVQDLARQVVAELLPFVVAGVSEIELYDRVVEIGARLGSEGNWTEPTTRVGLGTLVAHPDFPMQDRKAVAGDTVVIDVNPTLDGWFGDYCVTVQVGESLEAAALIREVREIQQNVITSITPGMTAAALYEQSALIFNDKGLKNFDLLDNIGHSIGRDFASEGFIDASNDQEMWGAWTIEPQLGRNAKAAKFEDIVWLAPGQPPRIL